MKTTSTLINTSIQSEILQQLLENQKRFAEVAKGELYPKTFEDFRRRELANYMKREKGRKRLRKKKALKRMREVWSFYLLTRPMSHFVNYQELGKKLFSVEPLPDGAKLIYENHTNNERHRIAEIMRGVLK